MRDSRNVPANSVTDRLRCLAEGSALRVIGLIRAVVAMGPWSDTPMTPHGGFVDTVRGHDFSDYSDTGLKAVLLGVKKSGSDESVTEVFALVAETVSRRLGAWQIFSDIVLPQPFQGYRECAEQVLKAGPHRSHLGYYTDDDFLESSRFQRSVEPLLGEMNLDHDEATIVSTMVYVAEKRKVGYDSDIDLPAEFYRALSANDAENKPLFQVTDEQLLAGGLLYEEVVVEMNAGEGKTIAAAFPGVLHALLGRQVHIITANDYLASRDAEWLAPVYESLGLSVRSILSHMSDVERQDAYKGHIVYGTLREFGFDFLRDNLRYDSQRLVQRSLDVAIVDEADQVLIDESRTPLIIAGGLSGTSRSVHRVRKVVELLKSRQAEMVSGLEERLRHSGLGTRERCLLLAQVRLSDPENSDSLQQLSLHPGLRRRVHAMVESWAADDEQDTPTGDLYYVVDARNEQVTLTERGQDYLEHHLGPTFDTNVTEHELAVVESSNDLPVTDRRKAADRLRRKLSRQHQQMNQLYQMMRACVLLKRDVDYIVVDGAVILVDRLTGRTRPDSLYQHGLQACIEAKEGVTVHPESEVQGQISVQGFMKQYSRVAGMTGTAVASREEFQRSYGLEVEVVPPSNPLRRTDFPTRVYTTRQDKLLALVDEVKFRQNVGQPVLVGAQSIDQSEEISQLLERHGVEHRLLNAVNTSEEAQVVRSAGSFGTVIVATNMAGRGTDIILEPRLATRIMQRYTSLVEEFVSDGVSQVALGCATREEADMLESAFAASTSLSVTRTRNGRKTEVIAAPKSGGTGVGREVSLEFGVGLHVIGTEMNESRRIDDQLRGRGGRQGEFGSSRFILSLEDRPLVFHSAIRSALSGEMKCDTSRRTFFEGRRTSGRVSDVQAAIEIQNEAGRRAAWEYCRVIERQTMSYYRARWEVVQSTSFRVTCEAFTRDSARRIVDHYLPPSKIDRYPSQFERMADELRLDYQVSSQPLMGLGTDALKEELERIMVARLEQIWVRLGEGEFDVVAKTLFLQTGDELWAEHLSRLHELMLTTCLCAHGHKAAVADYIHRSVDAYRRLREEVIDTFLPRLVSFRAYGSISLAQEISVHEDVQRIMV